MSYILDALRKSEALRNKEPLHPTQPDPSLNIPLGVPSRKGKRWQKVSLIAGGITLCAVVAFRLILPTARPTLSPPSESLSASPPPRHENGPRNMAMRETAPPRTFAKATRPEKTAKSLVAKTAEKAATEGPDSRSSVAQPPELPTSALPAPTEPTRKIPAPQKQNKANETPPAPLPTPSFTPSPASSPTPAPASIITERNASSSPRTDAPLSAPEAYKKGWENVNEGLFNLAYDDFSAAVAQEPGFAKAWFARAWTEEKRGHREKAISDYTQALKHAPTDVQSLLGRGILRFYAGEYSRAVEDFRRATDFSSPELTRYALLWLYITDGRLKGEREVFFRDRLRTLDLAPWPGPLLRYFTGGIDRNALEEQISAPKSQTERRQRACVAYYFLGEQALNEGRTAQAKRDFSRAVQTGMTKYRQYEAARIALDHLTSTLPAKLH